jgi:hypothetical protein
MSKSRAMSVWAVLACMLALAAVACGKLAVSDTRVAKLGSHNLVMGALGGPDCEYDLSKDPAQEPECSVTIETIPHGDQSICVVSAPRVKVNFKNAHGGKAKVVWKLKPPSVLLGKMQFHSPSGVLVLSEKVKDHVKGGGVGDGAQQPDAQYFHRDIHQVKNNANQNGDSAYVPIVIWKYRNARNEEVEDLCAAVDPKIVNTN